MKLNLWLNITAVIFWLLVKNYSTMNINIADTLFICGIFVFWEQRMQSENANCTWRIYKEMVFLHDSIIAFIWSYKIGSTSEIWMLQLASINILFLWCFDLFLRLWQVPSSSFCLLSSLLPPSCFMSRASVQHLMGHAVNILVHCNISLDFIRKWIIHKRVCCNVVVIILEDMGTWKFLYLITTDFVLRELIIMGLFCL